MPLRGLIWASKPGGKAMAIPVGINARAMDASVKSLSISAERSIPADPSVM
jgi:hypothetical protein